MLDEMPDVPAILSRHNPSIRLRRRPECESNFFSSLDITIGNSPIVASTKTTSPEKMHLEIVEEILHLERKIAYLERHLLFLYQSAFERHFAASPITVNSASTNSSRDERDFTSSSSTRCSHTEEQETNNTSHTPMEDFPTTMGKSLSKHQTLADFLGTSIQDHLPDSASKLSEDMIRCIAAVYCNLASSTNQHLDMLASASSSISSSSTLSPKYASQICSPHCWYEVALIPCATKLTKNKHDPYKDMIEVPEICISGERSEFVSKRLKIFSSLIGRLESVDPSKMEQQEQLAFWINIHNALVMHAFLANGPQETSSILEATCHIGGFLVNPYSIQSLILGCGQSHCPTSQSMSMFASSRKCRKANSSRHPYALHLPEPLTRFALCTGSSSDPAVRIYTARDVHQELKLAKREYIQSKVSIQKDKLILPTLLYFYTKEASIQLPQLIQMISFCMQEDEQRAIQECFQRKGRRTLKLAPYEANFRFLLHRDLATEYRKEN
ncbi:hypothetical protein HPP92_019145 [Vanilla planifolia]|uniref:DUF547 domain-containing protein n=1 Tax=Vanilla planifolia TaxID=51239 RepID=A0A835UMM6_VANPL|nr:hypothetical protein HPP92_019145 [Vanilla planifolia]